MRISDRVGFGQIVGTTGKNDAETRELIYNFVMEFDMVYVNH
jgi:hypothetical protein